MSVHIKQPGDSLRPVSADSTLPTLPPPAKSKILVYAFMALQVGGMLTGAIYFIIFIGPGLGEFEVHGYIMAAILLACLIGSWATHLYVLQKMK